MARPPYHAADRASSTRPEAEEKSQRRTAKCGTRVDAPARPSGNLCTVLLQPAKQADR